MAWKAWARQACNAASRGPTKFTTGRGGSRYSRSMPTFRHDGLDFHYQESGAGRPFCFQHGLGGRLMLPFALSQPPPGVRLLAFDARGHGQTRPLGEVDKLTFRTFAEDLRVFIEQLGLTQIILGGISMGAALALHFTLRWPEMVAALVLSRPAW